jgi:hypothetical protein
MLRFVRALLWLFLLLCVVLVAVVLWLVEPEPRTTGAGPPTPEDVAATRRFMTEVRAAAPSGAPRDADGLVVLSEADANGILRVAARMFPAGHAEVRVLEDRVHALASVRVPWPGAERWLNLEGVAPEFEGRPRLDYLAVGGWELPPAPFVAAARVGANLVLGERAGDVFLGSARRLRVENGEMQFTMALGEDDRKGFMRGLFGAMRGSAMPEPAEIDAYYVELRQALDDGVLPDRGSYLPHLLFVLTRVLERSNEATLANGYTAGIFALTKACGAQDFALVVGRLAGDQLDSFGEWRTDCSAVPFADRIDTRRHFTTAAALRAASNRGMSVSVGEFKELYDSLGWKRGGFDFSDIAANQSGIRLSDRIMSGTRADLERTLALMRTEADVLVDLSRVPAIMPRAEFEARFGSIESEAYAAMLAEIEALIDEVPIHRPRP